MKFNPYQSPNSGAVDTECANTDPIPAPSLTNQAYKTAPADKAGLETVEFEIIGKLGKIILNRSAALNALSLEMISAIHAKLRQWRFHPEITMVLFTQKQAGRAFCAGGDVREIYEFNKKDAYLSIHFFEREYKLNRAIFHYPKPIISLIDGVWMGGGVGLALNGRQRIISENAVFAMPEGQIGYFADVGSNWHLARLNAGIGNYLTLTAAKIGPRNSLALGLATHYGEAAHFPAIEAALVDLAAAYENLALSTMSQPNAALSNAISDQIIGHGPMILPDFAMGEYDLSAPDIGQKCKNYFHLDNITDIAGALKSAANTDEFAAKSWQDMQKLCPFSLAIMAEIQARAGNLSFDEVIELEYEIAQVFCKYTSNFREGVRALLIDKDKNPRWAPSSIAQLDMAVISKVFTAKDSLHLDI